MKTTIARRWAKALRSGRYVQTTDQLRNGEDEKGRPKMCCLGVLCDLHAKSTKTEWRGDKYLGLHGELPVEVQEWAGIKSDAPDNPTLGKNQAIAMNDSLGRSFKQIALAIERNIKTI